MKQRLLLISTLLPLWAAAQEVRPVLSADYLALIKNDSVQRNKETLSDSTNSMRAAILRFSEKNFSGQFTVGRIQVKKDNTVTLLPTNTKYLYIGGTASSSIELLQHNNRPATQKEYAQGRSAGGSLVWRGPETGELFSYGPALSTLSHNGSNYIYDNNGRLVPGSGITAYNNGVLRNGSLLSHAVTLHTRYKKNYYKQVTASFKAGQSREQTIISTNKNKADNFSAFLSGILNKFSFNGHYDFRQERFTHNNRNGFLNRVYQNSLLTPASFANRQGNTIDEATQRSYSPQADNPFFLLADEGHSFLQRQQTGHLTLEQRINKVKFRVSQSIEELRQRSNEGYQPGTAFFAPGAAIGRTTHDKNYSLNANVAYNSPYLGSHFRIQSWVNYIYTTNRSAIAYSTNAFQYGYQRSSHDLAFSVSPDFNSRISDTDVEASLSFTGKLYGSNTSTIDRLFLPSITGNTLFRDVFNIRYAGVKFFGGYNRFNSELPVNRSFAYSNLLQYSVANVLEYLPLTEVKSFDNLAPIEHRESLAGIEMNYQYLVVFSATWFSRHTLHDLFPVMNGNEMNLVNMASHRNRGIELELRNESRIWKNRKFGFGNSLSFVSYRSKVTDVVAGYNYAPIAGFTDVHKAIVKGQPLGVIVGNSWLRDGNNNILIGNDGFPLVNNTPKVIGNPIPDFTMKMTHRVSYKNKWTLNVDWEWKKGGDMWNGTEALLDYYGRSANSSALRNTTGYVFNGVLQNGNHNNIPVSFYDPSLPVEQNRWVRYGHSGVAESYIQKGDCIRLNTIGISYKPTIKKHLQDLSFSLYANNIILWSAYKGADPNQLLNDEPNTAGLDLFNLPSVRTIGFNISLQF